VGGRGERLGGVDWRARRGRAKTKKEWKLVATAGVTRLLAAVARVGAKSLWEQLLAPSRDRAEYARAVAILTAQIV